MNVCQIMILGYQDIKLSKAQQCLNYAVDKINHYCQATSLIKKPLFKKYKVEKPLVIKSNIPVKIMFGTGCFVEKNFCSLVKNLSPNIPYIIIQPYLKLDFKLLNGIHDIKHTLCFSPKEKNFHIPLNFFEDVFSLKSIKDIITLLAPNETEYQKYLYEKPQIEKIKKTVKALFTYLCIQLKRQKDKGQSINLKSIKSVLENFTLYQDNSFYLKMLNDMNYLPNHTTLTAQMRHFQITQIVWQIYFAHFLLLEKQGVISNNGAISLQELIKNKKNYIINNYLEHNCYHPFNNILITLINLLLKEQKTEYQLILLMHEKPILSLDTLSEYCHYQILNNPNTLKNQDAINLINLAQKEKIILFLAHDIQFEYEANEQLNHLLSPLNKLECKELGEKHFLYINNTWEKVDRLHESNKSQLNQEDYETLKTNKLKIVDELMSLKEKSHLEKILVLNETQIKKPIKRNKI